MSEESGEQVRERVSQWWTTAIIDIEPGKIGLRGRPIQELIGAATFTDTIWLMLRGELPSAAHRALLDAALTASVDHGPHAPSIAIARMAVTCGVDLNSAMSSAIGVLGDVHGGAGQHCMELLERVRERRAGSASLATAVDDVLESFVAEHGKFIPGFGHRFHPVDPRCEPLLGLVERTAAAGGVSGEFAAIGRALAAGTRAAHRQAYSHEHRRRDRGHLLRARIPAAARARPVHPVALGRNPGARLGADAAGWPQQGPDTARDAVSLLGSPDPIAPLIRRAAQGDFACIPPSRTSWSPISRRGA